MSKITKDKPIIMEHHDIKEIMSMKDANKFAEDTDKVCNKCKHFNCVCDLPTFNFLKVTDDG